MVYSGRISIRWTVRTHARASTLSRTSSINYSMVHDLFSITLNFHETICSSIKKGKVGTLKCVPPKIERKPRKDETKHECD